MAASAGGIAALTEILAALTGVFPAAVAIVQHRAPRAPSDLAHVLNRRSAMLVTDAKDSELIRPTRAYLAPADHHLLVNADGTFSLTQSAKVHSTRPAAEKLFESAAKGLKERIIGVILTGADSDGENGVRLVKGPIPKSGDAPKSTGVRYAKGRRPNNTGDRQLGKSPLRKCFWSRKSKWAGTRKREEESVSVPTALRHPRQPPSRTRRDGC